MFGIVPRVIWRKAMPPDRSNRVAESANCILIELDDGRRGIVEAGCGDARDFDARERRIHALGPGSPLMETLERMGLDAADIDFVVLSHLHWDHVGGVCSMVDGRPTLTFLNAMHYVHAVEWAAAGGGDPLLYKSYPQRPLTPLREHPDRVHFVEADDEEVLPGIRMVRSSGHTHGHCAVVLGEGELSANGASRAVRRAVFAGDNCPTQHHLRMVFQTAFDTHPLDTRAWKRRWLPEIAESGDLLLFCHDPDAFGAWIRPDPKKEFVVVEAVGSGEPGAGSGERGAGSEEPTWSD